MDPDLERGGGGIIIPKNISNKKMFFQNFFELYYLSFWGYFFILSGSCAIVFKKELKICKDENTLLYVYFFLPFVEFTVKVMMNKCNF